MAPSVASRRWRLALFFALYLYQGLVAGFGLTALANHYAATGFSVAEVGRHFALVGVPWVLQPVLWGPLVDRATPFRMGPRRFWAVAGLVAAQATLAGLLLVEERAIVWVSAVLCGHSLFASLVDTAADRMVTAHSPVDELGRASAASRGGFVVGSALAGALFGWLLAGTGFRAAVVALLAVSSLVALAALLVREGPGDALLSLARVAGEAGAEGGRVLARLARAFRRREALTLLLLCFSGDFVLSAFQVPFGVALVQEGGWDAAGLSRLQAGLALASGTLGALAVGLLADRAGPVRALAALFAATALAFLGVVALAGAGLPAGLAAGPAILALGTVVPALLGVALVPAVMLASRERAVAATQFQVYMATMNLGDVAGAAAADALSGLAGPVGIAALAAGTFTAWAGIVALRPALLFGGDAARDGARPVSAPAPGAGRDGPEARRQPG